MRSASGDEPTDKDSSTPPAGTEAPKGILDQDHLFGFGELDDIRSNWEDKGVIFDANYLLEVFGNPIGGLRKVTDVDGQLDLELTLDFKKLADWDGSFHVSANYSMGDNLSANGTGDLLGVSNANSYNTLMLFELWYEQRLFNDKFSIRVGQMGADSEFFISSHAALFLNNTYGWPAIVDANAPSPSGPYGAPGVRLRCDPDDQWTLQAAVFAGNPAPDRNGDPNPDHVRGQNFDNSGTAFNIDGHDGVFAISELWFKLNQGEKSTGLPGTYKVGAWYHTGSFSSQQFDDEGLSLSDPDSDGHPRKINGNGGLYFIADQTIWQKKGEGDDVQEIGLFFRAGNAQSDQSVFNYYLDGGITFNGVIPGRPDDSFGIATAYGHISSGIRGSVANENTFNGTSLPEPDAEQSIEVTYSAKITPWWTVQPDVQFIVHPGGSSAIPDALVLGCRTTIVF
jgi:porin